MTKKAVVTGASSGIGAATARALAKDGYLVICAARRLDRIDALAKEIDGIAVQCDITDDASVASLAEVVGNELDVLINNAGGAVGVEYLADADLSDWATMFETNVLGTARVTQALLPALLTSSGTALFVTSTAAEAPYEGGAGYCGAKSAERSMVGALRLELSGTQVRVLEVSPGMVKTPEFSLVRLRGDESKADAVYEGVPNPLVAEDIAETIAWMVSRPAHVNIDRLVIRPVAQAANHKVFRVK